MAREKAPADDVVPLLEGLAIGDPEKVIAAARRQREAKRESGKKELLEGRFGCPCPGSRPSSSALGAGPA